MAFELRSRAFEDGAPIPVRHTCSGDDVSPPLAWSGEPEGTRSFALVVEDPDAPRGTFVHWVLFDIPAHVHSLDEGAGVEGLETSLPDGARQGMNDFRQSGWRGPCPPEGKHRYFFRLHALDTRILGLVQPSKAELEASMAGHILDTAELMGTCEPAWPGPEKAAPEP